MNAHPEFCALLAAGHARRQSEPFLCATNQKGDHVWRLPAKMDAEFARPEIAWKSEGIFNHELSAVLGQTLHSTNKLGQRKVKIMKKDRSQNAPSINF